MSERDVRRPDNQGAEGEMMMRELPLVVIGCGKEKQPKGWRGPIVDLYTGSYYRAVLAYAQALGGPHVVLSAFHGPRRPSYEAHPYDRKLSDYKEVRNWFNGACESWMLTDTEPGDAIIVLAGRDYYEGWIDTLRANGRIVETPLAGMGIGKQKQWLAAQRQLCLLGAA